MAVSSTFSTSNQYVKYRIECTTNWQDIANNISNVTVKVFVWRTNTGYTTYGDGTCYCYINGTNYEQAISYTNKITSSGTYIFSKTLNITHNADGTKTLSTSAYFNIPSVVSSNSNAASFTLTTIPRTSSVTCNSFYIGDSTTITINRASSTFTHTVKYVYGSLSGTIATKTSETSIGWTPPTTFYGQIPNGTTGYGSVTCETYSGDTLIGTATANFNAYAKESDCIPDVSATIVDTNANTIALTGDSSKLIKYLSKPQVTVNASAKNSASIRTRRMAWEDGQTSTETTATFNNGVTSSNITVSATDSRGYSKSTSYNLSPSRWVEYVKLAFSNISLSRTESTGSTATIKVLGNYFNGSFGAVTNSFTLKYRYKEEGGNYTNYTTVEVARTNDTFDYSTTLSNIDYKKQYIFEFVLEDAAMVVSSGEKVLEKGEAIFRIGQDYTKTNGRMLDEYGAEIVNGLSKYRTGGVDINPDTTIEELILTETNTPDGGFWYVRTMFYANKSVNSNRTQIAYPYAYDSKMKRTSYMRIYVSGIGWGSWVAISSEAKAEDYSGVFTNGMELKETGWVTITPVANTPTAVNVAFKKAYSKIPVVLVTASSGVIGTQVLGTGTNGITKTSTSIVLTRTNTTPTTVYYFVLGEV